MTAEFSNPRSVSAVDVDIAPDDDGLGTTEARASTYDSHVVGQNDYERRQVPFGLTFPWGDGPVSEWRPSTPGTPDQLPEPPTRAVRKQSGPKRRTEEQVLAELAEAVARYCKERDIDPLDCDRAEIAAAVYTPGSLDNLMARHGLNNMRVLAHAWKLWAELDGSGPIMRTGR